MLAVLAVLLCTVASAEAAPPSNDSFTTPQDVPLNVLWAQSNAEATTQGGELLFCGGTQEVANTVWYRIPGTGGPITITTGSNLDTILAVYTDTDPTNPANNIVCNDDASASTPASQVTFTSVAGARYLIQIGGCVTAGCGTATGNVIHVSLGNNHRAFAEPVAGGSPITRANYGASTDTGEVLACAGSAYDQTVWFRYTAPAHGRAVFSASPFNDAVAVYQGGAPTPLACGAGNPAGPSAPRVSVDVAPGDYYIQVGTLSGGGGDVFNLQVEFTENRDVDGDGESKDTDCDDFNRGRRHGIPDVPGNGVDEDCSGADAPADRDGDGIPDARDKCKTRSSRARDRNRDGCLDPLPFSAEVVLFASPTSTGVSLRVLAVTSRRGSKVVVRCSAGCTRRARVTPRNGQLTIPLGNSTLRSGARVRIWITVDGRIGKYIVYTIRRGSFRKSPARCLPPGSLKPRTSCI